MKEKGGGRSMHPPPTCARGGVGVGEGGEREREREREHGPTCTHHKCTFYSIWSACTLRLEGVGGGGGGWGVGTRGVMGGGLNFFVEDPSREGFQTRSFVVGRQA
jgi:hypothetical protein